MANYLNPELCRIIREYSYTEGRAVRIDRLIRSLKAEQKRCETRLAEITPLLEEANVALEEAKEQVKQVAKTLEKRAPRLNRKLIRPIVPTPKIGGAKWGDFKREMIQLLKDGDGQAISTKQIMDHFATKYGIPRDTPPERESLRQRILRRLEELAHKGAVQKQKAPDGSQWAYWLWVGLE